MTTSPMRAALENARDALIKIGFEPKGRLLSPILAALALPSEPSNLREVWEYKLTGNVTLEALKALGKEGWMGWAITQYETGNSIQHIYWRRVAAPEPAQQTDRNAVLEAERKCIFCRTSITACMGFTLARDTLNPMMTDVPREMCGRCVELITGLFPNALKSTPPQQPEDK